MFNVEGLLGWVYKATHVFNFHNTPLHHMLFIASVYVEGKVISWFQKMEEASALTN